MAGLYHLVPQRLEDVDDSSNYIYTGDRQIDFKIMIGH